MKSVRFKREGRSWEMPDAFYRVAIKLLILDDDGRLLVEKDETNGAWEVPGGGLDHGESIHQTAVREILEELGVALTEMAKEPVAITVGKHPDGYPTIKIYYTAKLGSYDFELEEKFSAAFVTKDEFSKLYMLDDENPIKQHIDKIWP